MLETLFGLENKQQFWLLAQVKNLESMIFIVKVVLTSLVHHLLNSTAGKQMRNHRACSFAFKYIGIV